MNRIEPPTENGAAAISANSMACLYGPAQRDAPSRRFPAKIIKIEIHAFNETNTRIRPAKIVMLIEKDVVVSLSHS